MLNTGHYQLLPFALSTHFPDEAVTVVKWNPKAVITAVYWEGDKQQYNVKRFNPESAKDPVQFHHRTSGEQTGIAQSGAQAKGTCELRQAGRSASGRGGRSARTSSR